MVITISVIFIGDSQRQKAKIYGRFFSSPDPGSNEGRKRRVCMCVFGDDLCSPTEKHTEEHAGG